ncbi:MAG: cytochrome c oxidase accessory protein CcoG [Bdellovibrionales bacterium]|nr:cytochrome c oxidase accessory protein CcoG [Bdellovibrionales bacterium]
MSGDFRETLYTVDAQGRRKWVYSEFVPGRFTIPRGLVAYSLMLIYLVMPWITIGGKQGVHLDIFNRRFVFFGAEFWATDSYFLFLILVSMAFSLFFFTALFGRLWCGWACPETVFLEFMFRPIERLIEGSAAQRRRLDQQPWNLEKIVKKLLKHSISAFFAWIIATTALAYFIGRDPLIEMISDWPYKNPVPFAMTVAMMGLMAFQFGWFREQFCTVLCPYARFQSVLMDSNSIVVGYDVVRGEPRGKVRKREDGESTGDCVDCGLCVRVCPTGIDIRNGLQLECVACTACADACDSIMEKVGRPKGLVRYDTEDRLLGRSLTRKLLRPRPIVYGVLLTICLSTFAYLLSVRQESEFQVLRGALDEPFTVLDDGRVSNHLHVRVTNKSSSPAEYTFSVTPKDIELITPLVPFSLHAGQISTTPIFLNFDPKILVDGKYTAEVNIAGGAGYSDKQTITLLGPGK